MKKKKFYIPIKMKFVFTLLVAILWVIACFIIDRAWFWTMASTISTIPALIVLFGMSIIPGVMICFFSLTGLLFDKPLHYEIKEEELEPITILVAAYNEEDCIYDTIKSIVNQDYPEKMIIKIIDNNSNDRTKEEIMRAINDFSSYQIEYIFQPVQGKYAALNLGVSLTNTRFFITVDADTYLYKNAIKTLVYHMVKESKNKKVGAIAGTVLVRNSRKNLMTKLQEWEYFLSIATIKRSQGLFQTAMVAQGAFSIYNTELVIKTGGYKNVMAEDIVLTWELLSQDENWNEPTRTFYCDDAIVFTNVPETFKQFIRQRIRWSRGSINGFRAFRWKKCKNFYTKFYMFVNYFNIIGELGITFVFIPGMLLALIMKNYLFVGVSTLILFIITVLIYQIMFCKQIKYVFNPIGLKVRKHYLAFIIYMLIFSLILAPICLIGYFKESLGFRQKW